MGKKRLEPFDTFFFGYVWFVGLLNEILIYPRKVSPISRSGGLVVISLSLSEREETVAHSDSPRSPRFIGVSLLLGG